DQFKLDVAAELCAVLAFSAIRSNDKVGLILFTDQVEKYVPAKKGTKHVLRIIRELLYHEPQGRRTDIAEALGFLNRITVRKSVCFLVSDFLAEGYEHAIRVARRRHDLIPIVVSDRREWDVPKVGVVELHDPETDDRVLVDLGSRRVREAYGRRTRERAERRRQMFRRMDTEIIEVTTDQSYVEPLVRFFRKRERRR
ncbi:MAG TPA: VWA domain-containing protein, partial [Gammaproteobacteria bacterium]|nr:VWA domain-containing protein [Gammaproteobacteria bacterium]